MEKHLQLLSIQQVPVVLEFLELLVNLLVHQALVDHEVHSIHSLQCVLVDLVDPEGEVVVEVVVYIHRNSLACNLVHMLESMNTHKALHYVCRYL